MKKKINITNVSEQMIKKISEISTMKQYRSNADIIYKGHVPHCGFLLVEGRITLKIGRDKSMEIFNGSLIGIKEMMCSEPFKFDVNIDSNSSVFILDKSTIGEMLVSGDDNLKELFLTEVG